MKINTALQLWTVRDAYAADRPGTLARIAELGFDGVELVDTLMGADRSGSAARAWLDGQGLSAAGYHAHLDAIEEEPDRLLEVTQTLGCTDLVCAWLPEPRRLDRAAYEDVARSLATMAARCEAAGVQLVYHHHDFEYVSFDGQTGLDILCAHVPPQLLTVELDTYWVLASGSDPVSELIRLGRRCSLVHLKDRMDPSDTALAPEEPGVAHRTTELGTGVLDLPGVLRAAAPHVRWYIVEQDLSRDDPLRSAGIGLENLRRAAATLTDPVRPPDGRND